MLTKFQQNGIIRLTALLLLMVFCPTQTLQAAPFTLPDGVIPTEIRVPSLDIPAELATIREKYGAADGSPTFIYIEDAHANYDAQLKIKQILQWLYENEQIDLAFLEGAHTKFNPDRFRFFPKEEYNRELADALAKRGLATGAELFLLEANKGYKAFGIESPEHYAENLKAFRRVLAVRSKASQFLDDLNSNLVSLEERLLNPELKNLLRVRRAYEGDRRSLPAFVQTLGLEAQKLLDIDLKDPYAQVNWPQLMRLTLIGQKEKQLDLKKLESETKTFLEKLKTLSVETELIVSIESILSEKEVAKTFEFRDVRLVFEKMYARTAGKGFDFAEFPELQRKIKFLILRDELLPVELEKETSKLADTLIDALAKTEEEKKLIRIGKDIELLREGFSLELTKDSLAEFRSRIEELKPEIVAARFSKMGKSVSSERQDVSAAFFGIDTFYRGAAEREKYFIEKAFSELKTNKHKKAVLITGGFHTEQMTEVFKQKGISFIVLTPRLTEIDKERSLYYDVMSERTPTRFDRSQISAHLLMAEGHEALVTLSGSDPTFPSRVALSTIQDQARISRWGDRVLAQFNPASKAGASFIFKNARLPKTISGFGATQVRFAKNVDSLLAMARSQGFRDAQRRIGEYRLIEIDRIGLDTVLVYYHRADLIAKYLLKWKNGKEERINAINFDYPGRVPLVRLRKLASSGFGVTTQLGSLQKGLGARFFENANPMFVIGNLARKWLEGRFDDGDVLFNLGQIFFDVRQTLLKSIQSFAKRAELAAEVFKNGSPFALLRIFGSWFRGFGHAGMLANGPASVNLFLRNEILQNNQYLPVAGFGVAATTGFNWADLAFSLFDIVKSGPVAAGRDLLTGAPQQQPQPSFNAGPSAFTSPIVSFFKRLLARYRGWRIVSLAAAGGMVGGPIKKHVLKLAGLGYDAQSAIPALLAQLDFEFVRKDVYSALAKVQPHPNKLIVPLIDHLLNDLSHRYHLEKEDWPDLFARLAAMDTPGAINELHKRLNEWISSRNGNTDHLRALTAGLAYFRAANELTAVLEGLDTSKLTSTDITAVSWIAGALSEIGFESMPALRLLNLHMERILEAYAEASRYGYDPLEHAPWEIKPSRRTLLGQAVSGIAHDMIAILRSAKAHYKDHPRNDLFDAAERRIRARLAEFRLGLPRYSPYATGFGAGFGAAAGEKPIYFFGAGKTEGNGKMKSLLGGKGAGLAEMDLLNLPVTPGFTITTAQTLQFFKENRKFPAGLEVAIDEYLAKLEEVRGKKFGDANDPLLLAVRSGAAESMPGMMDTILNIGLNDDIVEGLARKTNNPRFAYDSYRRLIQMYGEVVLGVHKKEFDHLLEAKKSANGYTVDTELTADDLKALVQEFKQVVLTETGNEFPQNPREQLLGAIKAVFDSSFSDNANDYRKRNKIADDIVSAVNVQSMVFGNMGPNSATGVAFTRDSATGENIFNGEFLINAQGEDVVAGIRKGLPIEELENVMPKAHEQLVSIRQILEEHFRDMQDIEFTVEEGKLYMLQTRSGKRSAAAMIRIAVELVREGKITAEEALLRIEPDRIETELMHPMVDPQAAKKATLLATGTAGSPGAAIGRVVFTAKDAADWAARGERVILVRKETSADDVAGMAKSEGVLTAQGGKTSHAAVVARGEGIPAVVGVDALNVDEEHKTITVKGATVKEGDWITIDGSNGKVYFGEVNTIPSEIERVQNGDLAEADSLIYQNYKQILAWADQFRTTEVWANADNPKDALIARKLGAQGIGLARTEHMFRDEKRLPLVQAMFLAKEGSAERTEILRGIGAMQQSDFEGILEAMEGLPVTIRLLDPPIHEFLPRPESAEDSPRIDEIAARLQVSREEVIRRIYATHEVNPMLGTRGVRLELLNPSIAEMQARAMIEAYVNLIKRGRNVKLKIMIPNVAKVDEFVEAAKIIKKVADEIFNRERIDQKYRDALDIGTMIEMPSAAIEADEIAKFAEFFSFGTNDLTQFTFGMSRDDAAGTFLPLYIEKRIFRAGDPTATLDTAVAKLVKLAVERGRQTNPNLQIGCCGEHGGDPRSIQHFLNAGLNYVSASPWRIPIARIASAQWAIKQKASAGFGVGIGLLNGMTDKERATQRTAFDLLYGEGRIGGNLQSIFRNAAQPLTRKIILENLFDEGMPLSSIEDIRGDGRLRPAGSKPERYVDIQNAEFETQHINFQQVVREAKAHSLKWDFEGVTIRVDDRMDETFLRLMERQSYLGTDSETEADRNEYIHALSVLAHIGEDPADRGEPLIVIDRQFLDLLYGDYFPLPVDHSFSADIAFAAILDLMKYFWSLRDENISDDEKLARYRAQDEAKGEIVSKVLHALTDARSTQFEYKILSMDNRDETNPVLRDLLHGAGASLQTLLSASFPSADLFEQQFSTGSKREIPVFPPSNTVRNIKFRLIMQDNLRDGTAAGVPGVGTVMQARQSELAGAEIVYLSGASYTSNLGLTDTGSIPPEEVFNLIHQAARRTNKPILVDLDTVGRTPEEAAEFARRAWEAGATAVHIEDQEVCKLCGHVIESGAPEQKSKSGLVSPEEFAAKIMAMKKTVPELYIFARTDARRSEKSLERAILRAKIYLEAGADGIFPEALGEGEFETFAITLRQQFTARPFPLLANMTEFGNTPYLTQDEFAKLGYQIVIWPVTASRAANFIVDLLLSGLLAAGTQAPFLHFLQTRDELYRILGYRQKTAKPRPLEELALAARLLSLGTLRTATELVRYLAALDKFHATVESELAARQPAAGFGAGHAKNEVRDVTTLINEAAAVGLEAHANIGPHQLFGIGRPAGRGAEPFLIYRLPLHAHPTPGTQKVIVVEKNKARRHVHDAEEAHPRYRLETSLNIGFGAAGFGISSTIVPETMLAAGIERSAATGEGSYGEPKDSVVLKQIPTPKDLGSNDVLVAMAAAKANHSNTADARGAAMAKVLGPLSEDSRKFHVLGHDGVGLVQKVGSGVSDLKVGDVVLLQGHIPAEGEQVTKIKGRAKTGDGFFSQYVRIDRRQLHKVPEDKLEDFTVVQAAGMVNNPTTAYQAAKRANLKPTDTVLVWGVSGGTGSFFAQSAKRIFGVEHLVGIVSDERRGEKLLTQRFVDLFVNRTKHTDVQSFTKAALSANEGEQYDVVFNNTGADTVARDLAVLKPGGRLVPIGNTAGTIVETKGRPATLSLEEQIERLDIKSTDSIVLALRNERDALEAIDLIKSKTGSLPPIAVVISQITDHFSRPLFEGELRARGINNPEKTIIVRPNKSDSSFTIPLINGKLKEFWGDKKPSVILQDTQEGLFDTFFDVAGQFARIGIVNDTSEENLKMTWVKVFYWQRTIQFADGTQIRGSTEGTTETVNEVLGHLFAGRLDIPSEDIAVSQFENAGDLLQRIRDNTLAKPYGVLLIGAPLQQMTLAELQSGFGAAVVPPVAVEPQEASIEELTDAFYDLHSAKHDNPREEFLLEHRERIMDLSRSLETRIGAATNGIESDILEEAQDDLNTFVKENRELFYFWFAKLIATKILPHSGDSAFVDWSDEHSPETVTVLLKGASDGSLNQDLAELKKAAEFFGVHVNSKTNIENGELFLDMGHEWVTDHNSGGKTVIFPALSIIEALEARGYEGVKLLLDDFQQIVNEAILNNPKNDDPLGYQQHVGKEISEHAESWFSRRLWLEHVFPFLLNHPAEDMQYFRNLVVEVPGENGYAIFIHFFKPGGATPVHDHDGKLGIVVPLTRKYFEQRFNLSDAPEDFTELDGVEVQMTSGDMSKPLRYMGGFVDRSTVHQVQNTSRRKGMLLELYIPGQPQNVIVFKPLEGNRYVGELHALNQLPKIYYEVDPHDSSYFLAKPNRHLKLPTDGPLALSAAAISNIIFNKVKTVFETNRPKYRAALRTFVAEFIHHKVRAHGIKISRITAPDFVRYGTSLRSYLADEPAALVIQAENLALLAASIYLEGVPDQAPASNAQEMPGSFMEHSSVQAEVVEELFEKANLTDAEMEFLNTYAGNDIFKRLASAAWVEWPHYVQTGKVSKQAAASRSSLGGREIAGITDKLQPIVQHEITRHVFEAVAEATKAKRLKAETRYADLKLERDTIIAILEKLQRDLNLIFQIAIEGNNFKREFILLPVALTSLSRHETIGDTIDWAILTFVHAVEDAEGVIRGTHATFSSPAWVLPTAGVGFGEVVEPRRNLAELTGGWKDELDLDLESVSAAALKQNEAYPLISPLASAALLGNREVFRKILDKLDPLLLPATVTTPESPKDLERTKKLWMVGILVANAYIAGEERLAEKYAIRLRIALDLLAQDGQEDEFVGRAWMHLLRYYAAREETRYQYDEKREKVMGAIERLPNPAPARIRPEPTSINDARIRGRIVFLISSATAGDRDSYQKTLVSLLVDLGTPGSLEGLLSKELIEPGVRAHLLALIQLAAATMGDEATYHFLAERMETIIKESNSPSDKLFAGALSHLGIARWEDRQVYFPTAGFGLARVPDRVKVYANGDDLSIEAIRAAQHENNALGITIGLRDKRWFSKFVNDLVYRIDASIKNARIDHPWIYKFVILKFEKYIRPVLNYFLDHKDEYRDLRKKIAAALDAKDKKGKVLIDDVVFSASDILKDRVKGKDEWLAGIHKSLDPLIHELAERKKTTPDDVKRITIVYEPELQSGSLRAPLDTRQIRLAHKFIRETLKEAVGFEGSILYGGEDLGSHNATKFFGLEEIDGAFVKGKAATDPDEYLKLAYLFEQTYRTLGHPHTVPKLIGYHGNTAVIERAKITKLLRVNDTRYRNSWIGVAPQSSSLNDYTFLMSRPAPQHQKVTGDEKLSEKLSLERYLAKWSVDRTLEDIPEEVVELAKRQLINALSNSVRAFNYSLGRGTRASALENLPADGSPAATVFGTRRKTTVQDSILYLGSLVRDLDKDLTFLGEEPSHPDDNLAALLAVAEAENKSGAEVLLAFILAQEVQVRMASALKLRDNGIDHVSYLVISSAVGIAKLKGLNEEKTKQAISIATQEAYKLRGMRQKYLNTLKSSHAAQAQVIALEAVRLAEKGQTGPRDAFNTKYGFNAQLLRGLDLRDFLKPFPTSKNHRYAVREEVFPKGYQAEYHAQSAVEAALELHKQIRALYGDSSSPEDGLSEETLKHISKLDLSTFEAVITIIAETPRDKFLADRPTADHDIAYQIAHTLVFGWHDERVYDPDHLGNEKVQRLRKMLEFHHDEEATAHYYDEKKRWNKNTIQISFDDGKPSIKEARVNAYGHATMPWSPNHGLTLGRISAESVRALAKAHDEEGKRGWFEKFSAELREIYGSQSTADLINEGLNFDKIAKGGISRFMQKWAIPPATVHKLHVEQATEEGVPEPFTAADLGGTEQEKEIIEAANQALFTDIELSADQVKKLYSVVTAGVRSPSRFKALLFAFIPLDHEVQSRMDSVDAERLLLAAENSPVFIENLAAARLALKEKKNAHFSFEVLSDSGVVWSIFDNREAANAMSVEDIQELKIKMDQFKIYVTARYNQDKKSALVKSSIGSVFSAGAYINGFHAARDKAMETSIEAAQKAVADYGRFFSEVWAMNRELWDWMGVLTISAVHGSARGGGAEFTENDILTVIDEAKGEMAQPEITLGVLGGAGGVFLLPFQVGLTNALKILFSGGGVKARVAHHIGWVDEVAPAGGATARALDIAAEFIKETKDKDPKTWLHEKYPNSRANKSWRQFKDEQLNSNEYALVKELFTELKLQIGLVLRDTPPDSAAFDEKMQAAHQAVLGWLARAEDASERSTEILKGELKILIDMAFASAVPKTASGKRIVPKGEERPVSRVRAMLATFDTVLYSYTHTVEESADYAMAEFGKLATSDEGGWLWDLFVAKKRDAMGPVMLSALRRLRPAKYVSGGIGVEFGKPLAATFREAEWLNDFANKPHDVLHELKKFAEEKKQDILKWMGSSVTTVMGDTLSTFVIGKDQFPAELPVSHGYRLSIDGGVHVRMVPFRKSGEATDLLEFVEPIGRSGFNKGFLEENGPAFRYVAFETTNIKQTVHELERDGHIMKSMARIKNAKEGYFIEFFTNERGDFFGLFQRYPNKQIDTDYSQGDATETFSVHGVSISDQEKTLDLTVEVTTNKGLGLYDVSFNADSGKFQVLENGRPLQEIPEKIATVVANAIYYVADVEILVDALTPYRKLPDAGFGAELNSAKPVVKEKRNLTDYRAPVNDLLPELKAIAAEALQQDKPYPLIAPLVSAALIGNREIFREVERKLASILLPATLSSYTAADKTEKLWMTGILVANAQIVGEDRLAEKYAIRLRIALDLLAQDKIQDAFVGRAWMHLLRYYASRPETRYEYEANKEKVIQSIEALPKSKDLAVGTPGRSARARGEFVFLIVAAMAGDLESYHRTLNSLKSDLSETGTLEELLSKDLLEADVRAHLLALAELATATIGDEATYNFLAANIEKAIEESTVKSDKLFARALSRLAEARWNDRPQPTGFGARIEKAETVLQVLDDLRRMPADDKASLLRGKVTSVILDLTALKGQKYTFAMSTLPLSEDRFVELAEAFFQLISVEVSKGDIKTNFGKLKVRPEINRKIEVGIPYKSYGDKELIITVLNEKIKAPAKPSALVEVVVEQYDISDVLIEVIAEISGKPKTDIKTESTYLALGLGSLEKNKIGSALAKKLSTILGDKWKVVRSYISGLDRFPVGSEKSAGVVMLHASVQETKDWAQKHVDDQLRAIAKYKTERPHGFGVQEQLKTKIAKVAAAKPAVGFGKAEKPVSFELPGLGRLEALPDVANAFSARLPGFSTPEAVVAGFGVMMTAGRTVPIVGFDSPELRERVVATVQPRQEISAEEFARARMLAERVNIQQILVALAQGNPKLRAELDKVITSKRGAAFISTPDGWTNPEGVWESLRALYNPALDALIVPQGDAGEGEGFVNRVALDYFGADGVVPMPPTVRLRDIASIRKPLGARPIIGGVFGSRTQILDDINALLVQLTGNGRLTKVRGVSNEETVSLQGRVRALIEEAAHLAAQADVSGATALRDQIRDVFGFVVDASGRVWITSPNAFVSALAKLAQDARMQTLVSQAA